VSVFSPGTVRFFINIADNRIKIAMFSVFFSITIEILI